MPRRKKTTKEPRRRPAKKRPSGTHTFEVTKGYCTPARVYVDKAFRPLHIKARYGPVRVDSSLWNPNKETVPKQTQTVTVSEAQADWAEEVLGALSMLVPIEVTDGLRPKGRYRNGQLRKGIPMPWKYKNGLEIPEDDLSECMAKLPPEEREWMEKDPIVIAEMKKGRGARVPGGIRFTSERRRPRASDRKAARKRRRRR